MVIYLDGVHSLTLYLFSSHSYIPFIYVITANWALLLQPYFVTLAIVLHSVNASYSFIVYLVSASSYFSYIYVITANSVLLPYFVTLVLVLHSESACYVMYNWIFVTCILYSSLVYIYCDLNNFSNQVLIFFIVFHAC